MQRLKNILSWGKDLSASKLGYGVIGAGFVGLTAWAALAPLDSAVTAGGLVQAVGNRRTIQHFEGGIVRDIFVREGEHVRAGQALFELDPTVADAARGITRGQTVALQALEARLLAERDSLSRVVFPAALLSEQSDPLVAQAIADQRAQFEQRATSLQGQYSLLNAQADQFQSEISGIDRQLIGLKQQLALIQDELTDLRKTYELGLVPKPRLLALEREQASLSGSIGRLMADRAKSLQGISEVQLRIRQTRQEFFATVAQTIAETRLKLSESSERDVVAADTQRRVKIASPINGVAQNLRIYTRGAVIREGEPLVDIAPDDEQFIVQVHFSPTDIDNVQAGMTTEVRLPAFHSRRMPILDGEILSISGDSLFDPATQKPYFAGIVKVDTRKLPKEFRTKLTAGMPAEVIVSTGERTLLQYLLHPLRNSLRTTMREE